MLQSHGCATITGDCHSLHLYSAVYFLVETFIILASCILAWWLLINMRMEVRVQDKAGGFGWGERGERGGRVLVDMCMEVRVKDKAGGFWLGREGEESSWTCAWR